MKRMTMSMINDSLHHRWGRWWMTLMMTTDNTDQRDKEKKEANSISQELPSKCPVCKKGKKTTFSSISGWKNLVISWKGFATNAIYIIAAWWWPQHLFQTGKSLTNTTMSDPIKVRGRVAGLQINLICG